MGKRGDFADLNRKQPPVRMVVICPNCATRYDMPQSRLGSGSAMIRCSSCAHSWIESRAVEIIDVSPATRNLPAVIEHNHESDRDIQRLVEASREAQEEFAVRQRKRRIVMQKWAALAACLSLLPVMVFGLQESIVKAAPAAVQLYRAAGIEVNIYGLELRNIEQQHMMADGTRVLAVKGEIVNVSDDVRKIPSLRFGLRDAADGEVYNWVLSTGARPLRAGEITSFVTRVASPPETAQHLEIRFARATEIGSNAAP